MAENAAFGASRELIARHILEEAEPGRLRFLHDKFREVAHDRIAAARRASLHGAAGRAIESRCEGAAGFPLVYAKLARHFTEAGETGKAMEYFEKAGEHALRSSSSREAAGFFRELIAIDARTGGHRGSKPGTLARARWERRVVEAHYALGELGAMLEHARRGLSWVGYPLPRSQPGWVLRLLREIPVQVAHRIAPGALAAPSGARRLDTVEASLILVEIATGFVFTDGAKGFAAGLWAMNLAERAGSDAKLASAYASLGTLLGICRLPRLARSYYALARATAERTNDEAGLVLSIYAQAYLLQTRGGQWQEARALCNEALEKARRRGDRSEIGFAEMAFGMIELLSGRLHESKRHFESLARGAAERTDTQRLAASLIGAACVLLRMGKIDEAEGRLEQARAALEYSDNIPYRIRCLGMLASVYVQKGDLDRAITFADLASSELVKAPVMIGLGVAYGAAAEAYLARLARALESGPGDIAEARRALGRITSKLRMVSVICPIAWPIYHRVQGRWSWLEGAHARAKRSWERGLAVAVELGLPYEQALAHIDLAGAEPPWAMARRRHADLAEALCVEMGLGTAFADIESLRARSPLSWQQFGRC
jgi:tetratricopeptide (TPR) repeat protein